VILTILRQNNDRQLTCPQCDNSDLCTVTVSLRVCNTCTRSSQAATN